MGSCNSIHNGLPWSSAVTLAQDKTLLEPYGSIMLLCLRQTSSRASSRQDRDVVLTLGWLRFPSPDDQVFLSVFWLQSQLLQLPCHSAPVTSFLSPGYLRRLKKYSWSMKRYSRSMLVSFLPCCVWACTAKLRAAELAAAACSSSVGKAGAEIAFSKCQKDRPSGRKYRVKEQESEFASKQ